MIGKGWDDYSFEKAKTLYDSGQSMSQISRNLGGEGYNLTRSAIIGKLNRAGHNKTEQALSRQRPKRAAPPKSVADKVVELVKKSKPMPMVKEEHKIEYVGPIGTTPAWGMCQFTRDDIGKKDAEGKPSWQMCGHPVQVKGEGRNRSQTPWCESHGRICHQPPHKKPDAA